jgi:dihydrofolate reductase
MQNESVRIVAFILLTVDGFFEGVDGAFDFWAIDDEFEHFSDSQLEMADRLLFGRVTFEGMASYWPSAEARTASPQTATLMNGLPKAVVSTTLRTPAWSSTEVLATLDELTSWNAAATGTTLLLGSPTLTGALLNRGLVDELRILVNPVAIGAGRSLADCLYGRLDLELEQSREFDNGSVLTVYRPLPSQQDARV